MQLWQDGLVAFLAAIGLTTLVWAAIRPVLTAAVPRLRGTTVLLPARGDGEGLEDAVRTLRREGFGPILLVDCGLSGQGRQLCTLLCAGETQTALCARDQAGSYLDPPTTDNE